MMDTAFTTAIVFLRIVLFLCMLGFCGFTWFCMQNSKDMFACVVVNLLLYWVLRRSLLRPVFFDTGSVHDMRHLLVSIEPGLGIFDVCFSIGIAIDSNFLICSFCVGVAVEFTVAAYFSHRFNLALLFGDDSFVVYKTFEVDFALFGVLIFFL